MPSPRKAKRDSQTVISGSSKDEQKILLVAIGGVFFYVGWFCVVNSGRLENLMLALSRPGLILASWTDNGIAPLGFWDRIPLLFTAMLILAAAWILGTTVLRWTFGLDRLMSRLNALERIAFSIALGLNLLVTLLLVINYLRGGFRSDGGGFVAALAFLCVALLGIHVFVLRKWQMSNKRLSNLVSGESSVWTLSRRWRSGLIVSLSVFGFFLIWGAVLPPLDFDVREYHLQIPKEWYQLGNVSPTPHNIYGNMPLAAESLSLYGMLLTWLEPEWFWGALVGKTIMAMYLPLTAVLLFSAGKRFFASETVGWIAAVLCMTIPWLIQIGQRGLNENALACYLVCSLYPLAMVALQMQTTGSEQNDESVANVRQPTAKDSCILPYFFLSVCFVGAAVSVKYTAVIFVLLPLLGFWSVLLWWRWTQDRKPDESALTRFLLAAGLLVIAICASAGPWLLKNCLYAGNPVYPLASQLFGDPHRTVDQQLRWNRAHSVPEFSLPQITRALAIFLGTSRGSHPLLLPLVVVGLVSIRLVPGAVLQWRNKILCLAGSIGGFALLWFCMTHRLERFLVPIIPMTCLLAAVGAVSIDHKNWRWSLAAVFVISMFVNLVEITTPADSMRDTRFFSSLRYLKDDAAVNPRPNVTRINPAHSWLNKHTPAGKRVMLVGDAQPFDLDIQPGLLNLKGPPNLDFQKPIVFYNTCFDDCVLEKMVEGKTASEKLTTLQTEEIRYVLIHWGELSRYRSDGNYGYSTYVTRERIQHEFIETGIFQPVPAEEIGMSADVLQVFAVSSSSD
jgi:hypothetical protein